MITLDRTGWACRKMKTFGSLFAGVGGFDLGFHRAGMRCLWQVEWDRAAAGVLAHHWPDVPKFADVSQVTGGQLLEAAGGVCPDIVTFGFPCQDLSVAGKRAGMKEGTRSGLFYEAIRIIRELGGVQLGIAENVPGLFSADDGLALARCIRELLDSGARDVGWRVFDSQYFGVAQRRKRVFIVSDFTGERVPEILSFAEGLCGHPAPSREKGKGFAGTTAPSLTASGRGVDRVGEIRGQDPVVAVPDGPVAFRMEAFGQYSDDNTASTVKARDFKDATDLVVTPLQEVSKRTGKSTTDVRCGIGIGGEDDPMFTLQAGAQHGVAHTLRAEHDASEDGTGRGTPLGPVAFVADDYQSGSFAEAKQSGPLTTSADRTRGAPVVAFSSKDRGADAGELLSAIQEMGRSADGEGQSVCGCPEGQRSEANKDLQGSRLLKPLSREWILWKARAAVQARKAENVSSNIQLGKEVQGSMAVRRLTPV